MDSAQPRLESRLGILCDRIAAHTANPASVMEEITKKALAEGAIDQKIYYFVQHRIPFPGYERKGLPALKDELGIEGAGWSLEKEAFFRLAPYLSNVEYPRERAATLDYLPRGSTVIKKNHRAIEIVKIGGVEYCTLAEASRIVGKNVSHLGVWV